MISIRPPEDDPGYQRLRWLLKALERGLSDEEAEREVRSKWAIRNGYIPTAETARRGHP